MPELPEVELIVRDINKRLVGLRITGAEAIWSGYLEIADAKGLKKTVTGQRFVKAERIGKFIIVRLYSIAFLNHLRMTGNITKLHNGKQLPDHTHVVFELSDGDRLAFSDTRKFGRLRIVPLDNLESEIKKLNIGLEPLSECFTSRNLEQVFKGRSKCLKSALIDQNLVAGIGNIYACEILFDSGIDPRRPAGSLSAEELSRIVESTGKVLNEAIDRGGSSISDYRNLEGRQGDMQNHLRVYDREGGTCRRCGGEIRRAVLSGRSTYWCPNCQK